VYGRLKRLAFVGLGDLNGIDCEFRADDFAIVAVHTPFRLKDFGRVVTLFIKAAGKGQNVARAEFNAVSTPLAPVRNNVNNPLRNVNCLRIKWYTPELHRFAPHSYCFDTPLAGPLLLSGKPDGLSYSIIGQGSRYFIGPVYPIWDTPGVFVGVAGRRVCRSPADSRTQSRRAATHTYAKMVAGDLSAKSQRTGKLPTNVQ
jgi:hypothetical protein